MPPEVVTDEGVPDPTRHAVSFPRGGPPVRGAAGNVDRTLVLTTSRSGDSAQVAPCSADLGGKCWCFGVWDWRGFVCEGRRRLDEKRRGRGFPRAAIAVVQEC